MQFMNNLKIRTSVLSVLVLFALIIGAVIGLRVISVHKMDNYFSLIKNINVNQLNVVAKINAEQGWARAKLQKMISDSVNVVNTKEIKDSDLEGISESVSGIQTLLKKYEATEMRPEEKKLSAPIIESVTSILKVIKKQEAALKQGDFAALTALNRAVLVPGKEFHEAFNALMRYANDRNASLESNFDNEKNLFNELYLGLVLLTLIIFGLVYLGLRRSIIKPLNNAVNELQHISKANLSRQINVPGRNEIGRLFSAMRDMQQGLSGIVTGVRDGSDSILTGSSEIARGNTDLSSRTEQQAASLEETATSMEELTATVKQNADNARQASSLASDASSTASHGGEVMTDVTAKMQGISDSSQQVAEITGIIDSIAFQTNILALNASVEAARAGEQGRGFAVVAGEVRNLAQRSADAARDIKQLIESSSQQVQEGSVLVEKAGETMHKVVSAVKRVTDIMDEISAASQEQSSGIEEVNQAVSQMDEVTQQNAALVEQITTAAASLEDQAKRLEEEVAVFHLADAEPDRAGTDSPSEMTPDEAPAPEDTAATATDDKRAHATAKKREPALAQLEPAAAESVWEEF